MEEQAMLTENIIERKKVSENYVDVSLVFTENNKKTVFFLISAQKNFKLKEDAFMIL